jgi:dihydroxyacetone kinase-like protein
VPRSTLSYEDVLAWVKAYASTIAENREHLTRLDSAIGDADHGINMHRGMSAALTKLDGLEDGDVGTLLKTVGMALISTVGGAGGPLYGTLFLQMGTATSGKDELEPDDWRAALEAALAGVQMRGKAEPGDKTMVDALLPGKDALEEDGMRATVPLVARKGRASYLGERSAGHQDPGATSSYLLLKTAADTWAADD